MSRRARWARRADDLAEWFGLNRKGTASSGRARIPFRGAIVESRSVIRSAAVAVAQRTRRAGVLNALPWLHVVFSRKHRETVAMILDRKDAIAVIGFLRRRWTERSGPDHSATDSDDSVGGTDA